MIGSFVVSRGARDRPQARFGKCAGNRERVLSRILSLVSTPSGAAAKFAPDLR